MDTAVQERTWMPVAANGRVPEPHPDADPAMTRAAREARSAWRREHRAEWRAELEELGHFDPEFVYDVAHEYDHDWTTDPDYGAEGVHLDEYDEDGVVSPAERRARLIQERMEESAADPLGQTGLEADYEGAIRFRPDTVARVNRATDERHPVKKGVRPDLLVRTAMSRPERERFMPGGVLRLDRGAPVPRLALEVLSKGSANRDLDYKRRLYEAAGIAEYLIYDLGGKRRAGSPRELLMYRLEGGAYRRVAPEPAMSVGGVDAYWSEVFDTHIRMLPDAREDTEAMRTLFEEYRPPPRFQWYDPDADRWRDHETDAEFEREAERKRYAQELQDTRMESREEGRMEGREEGREEGRMEGQEEERLNMAVDLLQKLLSNALPLELRDRIEAVWRKDGPPPDVVDRILAVQQAPGEWRLLLGPDNDNGTDPR